MTRQHIEIARFSTLPDVSETMLAEANDALVAVHLPQQALL